MVYLMLFWRCRTASGTFQDGDLLLNQKGLRLVSEGKGAGVSVDSMFLLSLFDFFWCDFC